MQIELAIFLYAIVLPMFTCIGFAVDAIKPGLQQHMHLVNQVLYYFLLHSIISYLYSPSTKLHTSEVGNSSFGLFFCPEFHLSKACIKYQEMQESELQVHRPYMDDVLGQ